MRGSIYCPWSMSPLLICNPWESEYFNDPLFPTAEKALRILARLLFKQIGNQWKCKFHQLALEKTCNFAHYLEILWSLQNSLLAIDSLPIHSLFLNFEQICFFTSGAFLLFPLIPLEHFMSVYCLHCCYYHKLFHVKRIKRLFPLPVKVKLTEQKSHHRLRE